MVLFFLCLLSNQPPPRQFLQNLLQRLLHRVPVGADGDFTPEQGMLVGGR